MFTPVPRPMAQSGLRPLNTTKPAVARGDGHRRFVLIGGPHHRNAADQNQTQGNRDQPFLR